MALLFTTKRCHLALQENSRVLLHANYVCVILHGEL